MVAFKKKCSNPHPHGRIIIGTAFDRRFSSYYDITGRSQ